MLSWLKIALFLSRCSISSICYPASILPNGGQSFGGRRLTTTTSVCSPLPTEYPAFKPQDLIFVKKKDSRPCWIFVILKVSHNVILPYEINWYRQISIKKYPTCLFWIDQCLIYVCHRRWIFAALYLQEIVVEKIKTNIQNLMRRWAAEVI